MKEENMMSYEMYEDFKETMVKTIKTELSAKNNQSADTDLSQRIEQIIRAEQERHRTIIAQLAGRLENIEQSNAKTQNGIDNLQAAVEAIEIPAELPPRITQHRISLAIESKGIFWAMIGMMATIILLCTMLYWAEKPNYDRIDNDLKYRYVKMKGEATPDRIAELEEIFELHRDNAKIREMKRDVEEYERIIRKKIILEEQARLKEREANRLNENASRLKTNKPFPLSAKVLPPKEIRKVMQVATQTLRIFFPAAWAGRYQRKWLNLERQLLFRCQIPQYSNISFLYSGFFHIFMANIIRTRWPHT